MGDESTPNILGKHLIWIILYIYKIIEVENFDIEEGLHHNEYQFVIALYLVDNFCEENEGFFVWAIIQPMTHVPNVLFSNLLNCLLDTNDSPNPQLNEGEELLLVTSARSHSMGP